MRPTHQPSFRICAPDTRAPRDGRVPEELGTYDPCVADTDARVILKSDRVDYWLSVGAQPSEKVAVLIKKYGTNGTHLAAQKGAMEKLALPKVVPDAGEPVSSSKPKTSKEDAAAETEENAAELAGVAATSENEGAAE
jgi:small subunit ribosomal protein S16